MAQLKLTDRTVEGARAKQGERIELWDTHTKGLCLRVSPNTKAWLVRYRADGKQRRFVFGDFPDIKLADARIEAATILRSVKRTDADPAGARQRARAEVQAQPIKTFRQLADAYMAACRSGQWKPRGKPQSPRTILDAEGSLSRHILPVLGDLKLHEVTRITVRQLLRNMAARGIGAQTNKALAVIRQIYSYAIIEYEGNLVAANVATGQPREVETPRTRVLADDELKTLWQALKNPSGLRLPPANPEAKETKVYLSRQMAILLQLSLLLIQRRNELAGMMASEINLTEGVWLIPAPRMKARKAHLVPLPPASVALIGEAMRLAEAAQPQPKSDEGQPRDFPIFPSPHAPTEPIGANSVTLAFKPVTKALELSDVSPHDLRRTGSTIMTSERLGVTHFIRSLVLSHTTETGGGAAVSGRHYDANTYVAEKRRALVAWENLLFEIVGERARQSNVSPIADAKPLAAAS